MIQSDQDWTMVKRGASRGRGCSRAWRDGSDETKTKVVAKTRVIKFAPIVPGKENHAYSTVKDLIPQKLQKESVDNQDVVASLRTMTLLDLAPLRPVLQISEDADLKRGRTEISKQSSCRESLEVWPQHEARLHYDLWRVLHEGYAAADWNKSQLRSEDWR